MNKLGNFKKKILLIGGDGFIGQSLALKISTDFKNLSGDTVLVIPVKPYSNIYQFAKNGSEREWLALFRRVVKNFKKGQYISTHGHGVSWLHIRIEDYPKYFTPF